MTSFDPVIAKKMARVARSRAIAWETVSGMLQPPTREFVEQLRDGSVREKLEQSSDWVGEDNPMIIHLQSLRAFEGRSARIAIEQDIQVLSEDWKRLENEDVSPSLMEWASRAPGLCNAEADAWDALDVDEGKQSRLTQFEDMREHLQEAVDWAESAHSQTKVLVVRMLMRIFGAHLSIESGRDLLPQIMK